MAELKDRKDMDPRFEWDLATLYKSDEDWEKDLGTLRDDVAAQEQYRGRLNTAENILAYLQLDTALGRKISNLYTYAFLRLSEDTTQEKAQAMMQKAAGAYAEAAGRTSFATPEILSLPEEQLKKITESDTLRDYRFVLQQLLDQKPHVLSAEGEQLLARFSEVLGAPKTISENLMDADLTFADAVDGNGVRHTLNSSDFILLEQSPDRALRESAFHNYYAGYHQHINTFAATYSGAVKEAVTEAQVRHYDSSRGMAMAAEHVPTEVYDSLVQTVREFLPLMHRYAEFRKKVLGLDVLHYYDVYVPLTADDSSDAEEKDPGTEHSVNNAAEKAAGEEENFGVKSIPQNDDHSGTWTYEEAQQMALAALSPLGQEYTDTVKEAFESRWIDVYPNKGKRGGAFSSGTYDSNPFILMSYTGDYESVSTVVHEMGHSMHSWYTHRHQPAQYGEYTLFVAEVASTVNENLLIEYLLKKAKDPREKLYLLNQYLEGYKGTVFRQTMFAEFEQGAHAMAEKGEALTPAALSGLYGGLVKDYFGPALVMDHEVQDEWARIPHFYRPFYVYKYATSYCAAVALSEAILRDPAHAVKPYLEFLSMGGSAYPLDELRHAGVDLGTPAPVRAALEKFGRILDAAEAAWEELKGHQSR
ncbi:MAG: oligoendopeptidase F family protein [Lachnospiraceae bacterium]|nr:oligoendopeptidase F family protein [Lachnospiraceae bacterium]